MPRSARPPGARRQGLQPVADRHSRRARVRRPGGAEHAHEETGRIDFVVHTAGVLRTGKIADTDPETIEETVR